MNSSYEAAAGGGAWAALAIPLLAVGMIVVSAVFIVARIATSGRRREAAKDREQEIQRAAEAQGWQWQRRDPPLTNRWRQEPFRRGQHQTAGNVVRGEHRGREFVAFEFRIGGENTRPRTYAVYALTLTRALPKLQAGSGSGGLVGLFSRLFGLVRVRTGDKDLDRAWTIRTEDAQFARALFHDRMCQLLRETGVWRWGFEGPTMLSYDEAHLVVEDIRPRLDLMMRVIDQVPDDAWRMPAPPGWELPGGMPGGMPGA